MDRHFVQSPEQLALEVEFWRDFIQWWEHKHGRPAGKRTLEALNDAEMRYSAMGQQISPA